MNLAPKTATVERDGQELQIPVEEVQLGETLIVKAGESVPVDGTVIEGFASIDESALTGEVRCENYEQKYIGQMGEGDTPTSIRKRFDEHPPRTFGGHSISVSDVLVLNHQGEVTSYYVEKDRFVVVAGFIRTGSSSALISFDTTDFHIEGKEGSWLAYDSIRIDGREFFLMEHTVYGTEAANVVLDEHGKLVVDNVFHGFDETVKAQIKAYLSPPGNVLPPERKEKPVLENWQKAYENGEYLRSAEITEEQNYNMIDGRMNNLPPKPRKIGNGPMSRKSTN